MMTELINIEDLKDLNEEQIAEKVAQANEAYKKLQSDTERWAQQIIEEKKLAERSLKAISEINWDNAKLVELYESDKKLWDYLLKTVFGGASIDDFRDGGTTAKPATGDFDKMYQKKRIEERLEEVTSKLPADVQEKFTTEFVEITDGKELSKDNVDKYIKMALREVSPDYTKEELEAKVYSMGGQTAKPKTETGVKVDEYTSNFMQQMWIVTKAKKD